MKNIALPCPGRLRHVPRQFSWIDHRLVRDGHLRGRSPEALALYLLLCTVADARGVSYYSDASAGELLTLGHARLREARDELIAAGLIAYRSPFYQVLGLEPVEGAPPRCAPPARAGETLSAAQILQSMFKEPSR
jgi:hypothetical protein